MNKNPENKTDKIIRYILGSLLLLIAINAFSGGYYGMTGAKNIPLEWLNNSPFHNYFIPSLFLFVCVGGLATISAIAIYNRYHRASKISFIFCATAFLWLIVQLEIIGYVSWMQPLVGAITILILFLTLKFRKHEH